ncbi:MAG: response regulator transcription factor [Chitinophagaceae bacterium]|nr:response regulator transcription factor [Chitinophagaceae bacterium]MBK7306982.1 response regulator transcription factor [Chitinophagaceae bacterium]MBK8785239.1 response regulator transcription factor [Chitinophagaceae bacterium]MBK9484434.1 response regulator transcription factor [Chitinophagaceae bacterium]MBL0199027.1 response regulator transcription factor [Chitinophagaceae bacterium]
MLIAIVDDKPYLRNSLKEKLASIENEVTVIMEAGDGTDFIKLMKTASPQPDVVLMDIEMNELNGIETIQRVAPLYPAVKFIMLTVFDDDERIFNAIKAGAHGYLLKEATAQQIIDAIYQVYEDDGAPMSPGIARKAWKWLNALSLQPEMEKTAGLQKELEPLSEREKEILKCSMEGKEYAQIAELLFLSKHTVRQHMKNIYSKLHVSSKIEALQISLKNKWI